MAPIHAASGILDVTWQEVIENLTEGELGCREVVSDKGYLKNETLLIASQLAEALWTSPHGRTSIDKPAKQEAAFRANHRRVTGERREK